MAWQFLDWNPTPYASNGTIRGGFNTYWDNVPDDGSPNLVTLMVHHSRGSYAVRGFRDVPRESIMLFVDHEPPLNEPLLIEVLLDGRSLVTIAVTVVSDSPLISDPIYGKPIPVTIQSWPDHAWERAGKLLTVSDSPDPIIIEGPERSAVSTITLIHNQDTESAQRLEEMLSKRSIVRIRPSCPWLPAVWASARDRSRRRFSNRPDSVTVDTIALAHMGMPYPEVVAIGSTLLDLHELVPTTLADIAARWSLLRFIAADDLT